MSDDIIPFGKYRGQPVAALAQDQQYAEWLVAQPWFRERYATIYNVIINNFGPASEDTPPQHNAAQALFLDAAFRAAFIRVALPQWPRDEIKRRIEALSHDVVVGEATKPLPRWLDHYREKLAIRIAWKNDEKSGTILTRAGFETGKPQWHREPYQGREGAGFPVDVLLEAKCCWSEEQLEYCVLRIEVKPSVGDDYPSVLRQMKREGADTLFIGEYVGEGVAREQFVKIFNNEGIRVVFHSSVQPIDSDDAERVAELANEMDCLRDPGQEPPWT
jgi:hypothetical protein